MKKISLILMAVMLVFGCLTSSMAVAVEKPDFTKNVNVDRATDNAKWTIELPISDIGSKVSTEVKAKGDYTICVMTKNSTNPYMNSMWKGGEAAGRDMGVKVVTLAPAQQDSIEEQLAIMEAQIQQGVDGFVIHPSSICLLLFSRHRSLQ